jgi:hypothetical protein
MDATAVPGASCPAHLDQPISGTCSRCGGFLCRVCVDAAGGAHCASCVQREKSEALASLDVEAVIRAGFAIPLRQKGRVVPFVLIHVGYAVAAAVYSALVVTPAIEAFKPLPGAPPDPLQAFHLLGRMGLYIGALSLVGVLISALVDACLLQIFADDVRGVQRSEGEIWSSGVHRYLPIVVVNLLMALVVGVGLVACCVPGVVALGLLGLAMPAACLGRRGPLSALGESYRLCKPRFWSVLGVIAVAMAVVIAASVFSAGASAGLKFFGLPGAIAGGMISGVVGGVARLPLAAMLTVLYLRLRTIEGSPAP